MRFSWAGVLLAPLLAPLLFSAAMAAGVEDGHALLFVIVMVAGCIVSYGAMVLLFLPALYLLSSARPLNWLHVCLLGALLGALAFVPPAWVSWKSSGPDSGPPQEAFLTFLVRWAADPMAVLFPAAGLVTAALYWWLGTRRRRRAA